MKKTRTYIVSFSDSRRYLLKDGEKDASKRLVEIEKYLDSFLAEKFPEDTFAYFTNPKVVEVGADLMDFYAGYPLLDRSAVEDIKTELAVEIMDLNSHRMMRAS